MRTAYSQAQKWYERAAADGSDDAALSLGSMYFGEKELLKTTRSPFPGIAKPPSMGMSPLKQL